MTAGQFLARARPAGILGNPRFLDENWSACTNGYSRRIIRWYHIFLWAPSRSGSHVPHRQMGGNCRAFNGLIGRYGSGASPSIISEAVASAFNGYGGPPRISASPRLQQWAGKFTRARGRMMDIAFHALLSHGPEKHCDAGCWGERHLPLDLDKAGLQSSPSKAAEALYSTAMASSCSPAPGSGKPPFYAPGSMRCPQAE